MRKVILHEEAKKRGEEWEPAMEGIPENEWFFYWCDGCANETSKDPYISNCKTAENIMTLHCDGGVSRRVVWLDEDYICLDYGPRPKYSDPRQIKLAIEPLPHP